MTPTKRTLKSRVDNLESSDDENSALVAYKDADTGALFDDDGNPLSSDADPLMVIEKNIGGET